MTAETPDPCPTEISGRTFSKEELSHILNQHERWLSTQGKEGDRADLSKVDLRGANLSQRLLQQACISGADLSGADLRKTDLRKTDLSDTNLQGADVRGADLQGANLRGARFTIERDVVDKARTSLMRTIVSEASFQHADLRDVDWSGLDLHGTKLQEALLSNSTLEGATSLLRDRLAGADLTNATLPKDLQSFAEPIGCLKDACSDAQKIYIALILGCVYSVLTILTTTDAALVTNSSSSQLPIISTPVPIRSYYLAAPLVLAGVYLYFHVLLQRVWEQLARLPARLPDGRSIDRAVDPWILTGLLRTHVRRLQREKEASSSLRKRLRILWGRVHRTFQTRQAPTTSFASLQNFLSATLAWFLVPATIAWLGWKYLVAHEPWGTALHVGVLSGAVVFGSLSHFRARSTLRSAGVSDRTCPPVLWYAGLLALATGVGVFAYWMAFADSSRVVAHLEEESLSKKPANYASLALDVAKEKRASENESAEEGTDSPKALNSLERVLVDTIEPAHLRGRDLRGAKANGAFLVRADLGYSNLRGADLSDADLRGAYLYGSDLRDASLVAADLLGADFRGANLRGAALQIANLRGVSLGGADLRDAQISRADFRGADLSIVEIRGAKVRPRVSGLVELRGANLSRVNGYGADFRGANLGGTDFSGAELGGANFSGANLSEARFNKTRLWGADLSSVINFRQTQLDVACVDASTKIPEGLKRPSECPLDGSK